MQVGYTVDEFINPDYSADTYLRFVDRDGNELIGRNAAELDGVFAGVAVTEINVIVDLSGAVWGVNGAYLKVVSKDVTRDGARSGQCSSESMGSDVVNTPWETLTGAPTKPTIGLDTNTLEVNFESDSFPEGAAYLNFRKGGMYKICYSNLGTFDTGPADPLNIEVVVGGIYTDCTGDNCLANKVSYCYALKLRSSTQGSCVLDYSDIDSGSGYYGNGQGYYPTDEEMGRASWSSEFVVPMGMMDSNGHVLGVEAKPCTTEPNTRICPSGEGCSGSARFFSPDYVLGEKFQLSLPPTVSTLEKDSYVAFTVALCYCPKYDFKNIIGTCNERSDFVQQVGVIHFFAVKGCHIDDTNCVNDVSGIMPQYEFKLWVLCPTDACPRTDDTRVKLAPSSPANDRPWDMNNGCAAAEETSLLIEPGNCFQPDNCTVTGGLRQDYKSFGAPGNAFLLKNGHTSYEIRNFHESREYDVCFCLGDCENAAATWMKVGAFRFAGLRLCSAATDTADKPALEYVNYPGTVTFNRAAEDADVLGLQDGGVVKIVLDSNRMMGDKECGEVSYDNALVEGLTANTAGSDYRGKASDELNKLVFNNGNPARTLTVKETGIIAICYCAITTDSYCAHDSYWKLVTHLTMKGPDPSQTWTFSTNVVFRFDYSGWGLNTGDTLRIIETDAKCTDNEGNPNQADTSIFYNCPDNPTQVSNVPGQEWNFPTTLLTSETVRCNIQGLCDKVYIESVTVVSETETVLFFTGVPDLKDGDYITIGNPEDLDKSVQCDTKCSEEQRAEAQGVFVYADRDANDPKLADTYTLGHIVTKINDGTHRRYSIKLGWKEPPIFKTTPPGAQWARRNTASTREEIRGIKEKSNLKVCWSFGGNGKYVTEVGRINLRDPQEMVNARINLSTKAQTENNDVKAPVIISFSTTTSASGGIYNTAIGSMQLKLVFTDTEFFDGLFVDGTELVPNDDEDEVGEASQAICGRLMLESWSDDMTNGFPMPKGCYYRVIQQSDKVVPEVGIVFEEKNGLRQGYNYQIVMMGIAKHKFRAFDPLAEGSYLQIYSMDDVDRNPYGAVELGTAKLSAAIGREPEPTDPQFGPRGFTLMGGYDGIVEMDADTPIRFELRGGDGINTGRITPRANLRIFLFPVTQWTTGISCDARCVQHPENPFRCGKIESCVGDAMVTGFQNNFIKIRLPDDMEDLFAERRHTIDVGGLTLPSGAVFPSKLAAELTTDVDTNPHYTISVGDLIYKQPGKGRILARLVNVVGDGNEKPFREDQGNIIYFQLMFAGIMKAHQNGGAYFNIKLPEGYVIQDVGAVPSSLYVFGSSIPQGRGTLDPSGWQWTDHEITYTFPENFVIFSGSSLYVMVRLNNPPYAFKDVDPRNVWSVQMHGKGVADVITHADPAPFIGVSAGYASNAAVLGKLSDQVIQLTGFTPSTLKVRMTQELHIFLRSEQEVASGGKIAVFAPPIWHFDAECDARHLEDLVYATGPFESTYRLPGIDTCVGLTTPEAPNVRHRAQVSVKGRLNANTLFAFKLKVTNPTLQEVMEMEAQEAAHKDGGTGDGVHHMHHDWRLITMNRDDMSVDGSYDSVKTFHGSAGDSPGIYRAEFNPEDVTFKIGNMKPFIPEMATTPTPVTCHFKLPMSVKTSVQGAMRITAPADYRWESIDRWTTPAGKVGLGNVGRRLAHHDGGDRVEENRIFLKHRTYFAEQLMPQWPQCQADGAAMCGSDTNCAQEQASLLCMYGFTLPIKVPAITNTGSSNGFYIEIGYDRHDIEGRAIAGYSPTTQVRALLNPKVRYTYNVEGKENNMIFEIELTTPIPPQGGLRIEVPQNYRFSAICRPVMLAAYKDNFLPPGYSCRYTESTKKLEASTITIQPGPDGMPVRLYVFSLVGQNPSETSLLQADKLSPCGFTVCWPFISMEDITMPTLLLDKTTHAVGFSINRKMIQARLPLISSAVRKGTGRNDRPNQPNQLIFAFSLNADVLEEHTLTLRGPYGFGFNEDCLDEIVTREDEVFGEGNKWPPEYDPWEPGATILACAGEGTDALITISPGLIGEKKYAFRIGIAHNPPRTPEDNNQWVVDFAGETSEPFDGFILWTFTEYDLKPVSRARSQRGVDVASVGNAVKLIFKPYNQVVAAESGASYRLTLPDDFSIVHVNFECPFIFESLPYDEGGIILPGEVFDSFDINCKVDPDHKFIATMRLAEDMFIHNDRQYQMTLEVYNPATTTAERQALMLPEPMWMLETFAFPMPHASYARDAISIPSYEITQVLGTWTYVNLDPITNKAQVNGLSDVKGLQLIMEFPNSLNNGDQIHIHAPMGFTLEDEYGMCNEAKGIGNSLNINALANSQSKCHKGDMVIMVFEPSPVAKFFEVRWQVSTMNPAENLPDMENYWRVEHIAKAGNELSSHVFKGWIIIPQLESVMVSLVGDVTRAAAADASIEFSFRAVSAADSFFVQADEPIGYDGVTGAFNFNDAKTRDPLHMIMRAEGSECEILVEINRGDVMSIILDRVTLADTGGPTLFHLSTYSGGAAAGMKQDEKRDFRDGFRLPGEISISRSILESMYSLDPEKYPIQSMWNVRLGETAQATFRFYLSIEVEAGKIFHVNGGSDPSYMILLDNFMLMDMSSLTVVPTTLVRLVGNDLRVLLGERLRPNVMYTLRMNTISPTDVSRGNGNFLIECIDDEPRAVATNDGITPGFQLVVEMDFKVSSASPNGSPPASFIHLQLDIKPYGSRPTELQVYAPPSFNFTADCLIGGPPEVLSCQPRKAIEGRETAVIVLTEDGLIERMEGPDAGWAEPVVIKVKTPDGTPSNREWLLEGIFTVSDTQVGWGADSEGIRIFQMRDTAVMYAGATGIFSEFGVQFYNVLQLESGGMVEVRHPTTFTYFCDSFYQVSLPGEVACETYQESFRLAFNHTVAPGDYSFSILAKIPVDIPDETEFSVLLIDRHGDVQDAAMNVPGPPVKDNLIIYVPTDQVGFKWYPEKIIGGQVTFVEFVLTFEQDVPPDPSDAPVIGEILFTLPPGFVHDIRTIGDVSNQDDIWEPPGGRKVDFTMLDRVRITVDNGQYTDDPNIAKIIKKNSYAFNFPIIVPMIIPTTNIWVVSVCGIGGGCASPNDADVKLSFPLAGFQIGEVHPLTGRKPIAAAGAFAVLAAIFSMVW